MTISSTTNRISFAGNGVTTAFATSPVVFFDSADLTVYSVVTATGVSTLKTLTTDYTVTGGSGSTGTVTMLVAPATGTTLVIVRDVAATQGADLVNNDASDAEVIEDALDRLTMITQQLDSRLDRTFHVSDSDVTGIDVEVPDATTRALTVIGFDADGDIEFYDPASAVTAPENVGLLRNATGAVASDLDTWLNYQAFNVKTDFGAVGDGVTDDTTAIQNAINAAVTAGGGTVFLPIGNYKITTTLNLANKQSVPVTIRGEGHHPGTYNVTPTSGSNLYGLTAAHPVLETQGTHFVRLQNFGIYSLAADANKSAVGIFIGRTTVQTSAQYHSYSNVFITLADNAALNSSRGSVCLYNIQGEHGSFEHCEFRSDTPLLLFDNNPYPFVPVNGTLSLVASCTLNSFRLCSFISRSKYAMELRGIQSTTFQDCYYGSYGLNANPAINLTTGSNSPANLFFVGGQVETWNYFIEIGVDFRHIKIDTTWADASATGPLIRVDVNNNQKFYGLDAHFWNPQAVVMDLISVGASTGVIGYGCRLVLDNGIRLSASTLKLLGSTIEDWNTSPTTVTLIAASTYSLIGSAAKTFTPTISGSSGAGPVTYTVQVASYSLIGDRCFFQGRVTWTGISTFGGTLTINSLPFISANTTSDDAAVTCAHVTLAGTSTQIYGRLTFNANTITIEQFAAGVNTVVTIPAAGDITFSGNYRVG